VRAQEDRAENPVNKIKPMAFRCKSGLNSRFWLENVVFLPREAGRVNGMESWNWGLCPRPE